MSSNNLAGTFAEMPAEHPSPFLRFEKQKLIISLQWRAAVAVQFLLAFQEAEKLAITEMEKVSELQQKFAKEVDETIEAANKLREAISEAQNKLNGVLLAAVLSVPGSDIPQ